MIELILTSAVMWLRNIAAAESQPSVNLAGTAAVPIKLYTLCTERIGKTGDATPAGARLKMPSAAITHSTCRVQPRNILGSSLFFPDNLLAACD